MDTRISNCRASETSEAYYFVWKPKQYPNRQTQAHLTFHAHFLTSKDFFFSIPGQTSVHLHCKIGQSSTQFRSQTKSLHLLWQIGRLFTSRGRYSGGWLHPKTHCYWITENNPRMSHVNSYQTLAVNCKFAASCVLYTPTPKKEKPPSLSAFPGKDLWHLVQPNLVEKGKEHLQAIKI
jgi:hypothetical protein